MGGQLWWVLTDFEEVVPDGHKVLPEGQVGPGGLREKHDDWGEAEHLSHGEDELLRLLWDGLIEAAHAGLEQHRGDACYTAEEVRQTGGGGGMQTHATTVICHLQLHIQNICENIKSTGATETVSP